MQFKILCCSFSTKVSKISLCGDQTTSYSAKKPTNNWPKTNSVHDFGFCDFILLKLKQEIPEKGQTPP